MATRILSFASLLVFTLLVLSLAVRGIEGYPVGNTLNRLEWTDNGPLELSPERGRFALTYSIVEDSSFHFSLPLARFATPDLGYFEGKYVSLFAPGVSILTIPGYMLGRIVNLSQVGVYLNVALFALLNVILVRSIIVRLGLPSLIGWLSGLIFLFATPAFTYAGSLFQHHISTFLILFSLYLLLRLKTVWSLVFIWFLMALGVVVDYPNAVMFLPIAFVSFARLIAVHSRGDKTTLTFKTLGLATFLTAVVPLSFFLWFNQLSYGSPFKLSGTVTRVQQINKDGSLVNPNESIDPNTPVSKKSATGFFRTRNITNGLYIHFLSPDRGIVYFAPLVILGILGIFEMHKKNKQMAVLLVSIALFNVVLYSLWGDPWGGWAFGSRYLVPSYAIMSIFLSFAIAKYIKKPAFFAVFISLVVYSVGVNALGVLTSSRNPPFVEIANLEMLSGRKEKYSFDRNWEMLESNESKSFVYLNYLKNYMDAKQYYFFVYGLITAVLGMMTVYMAVTKSRGEKYV